MEGGIQRRWRGFVRRGWSPVTIFKNKDENYVVTMKKFYTLVSYSSAVMLKHPYKMRLIRYVIIYGKCATYYERDPDSKAARLVLVVALR
jgi:hypothetical protein